MDEEILLGDRELVPPKVEYRSSRSIVVVSWTRKSSWEIGNLSVRRSSTEVVDQLSCLMDEKILLGYRELVPPKVEYRSSRLVVVSWTKKILLGDRELSLRAAELMSLSPSYPIRHFLYLE